jgi:hypothetical protein
VTPLSAQREDVGEPFLVIASPRRFVRTIFFCLLGFELLLVFLDATVNYGEWTRIGAIRRLFNLTREDGLGNWFASTQTLFVGLVLWLVFLKNRRVELWKAWGWALLAVFFTYLAIDDGAKIHERIGTAVKAAASVESFPSYTWHLVFGPFLGAMGLFLFIFLWRELKNHTLRILFILGLGCYVVAVGLDFVEGLEGGYDFLTSALSISPRALRHFAKVFEEFLEMLGTTIFLVCFLNHFTRISPIFSVQFK